MELFVYVQEFHCHIADKIGSVEDRSKMKQLVSENSKVPSSDIILLCMLFRLNLESQRIVPVSQLRS